MLRSDLFGGHFKREVTKADSWPDIVLDDPVRIENVPLMRQRIAVVKAAKKREEQQQSRQMAMMRRNAPQLFVYKFYAEQAPLDLPFDKLNDVRFSCSPCIEEGENRPKDELIADSRCSFAGRQYAHGLGGAA